MRLEDIRAITRDIFLGVKERFQGSPVQKQVDSLEYVLEEPGPGVALDGNWPIWDGNPVAKKLYEEHMQSICVEADCSPAIWDFLDAKRKEWYVPKRSPVSRADEAATAELTVFNGKPLAHGMTVGHFMEVHYGMWYDARPIILRHQEWLANKEINEVFHLPDLPNQKPEDDGDALIEGVKKVFQAYLGHMDPWSPWGHMGLDSHAKRKASEVYLASAEDLLVVSENLRKARDIMKRVK